MKYQQPTLTPFANQDDAQGLCWNGSVASNAGAISYCATGAGVVGAVPLYCNDGSGDTSMIDCSFGGAVGHPSCFSGTGPI
jgi:hypothetical protein